MEAHPMTTFSPSFLEEIRNRLSVSSVVGSRLRLTRAGREFKGCCPFHNEKTPSFYINDDKQFFHCFGCGAHGDVIGFLMRHDHLSFPEAVENLAGQAGLSMPRDTPMEREKYDIEKTLYQLLERATAWFEEQLFAPIGCEGLAYLRGRGLGDEAIHRFRLGYAPNDGRALLAALAKDGFTYEQMSAVGLAKKAEDRNDYYSFFRNRVIFPVGDRRGRTVAFGARILGDGEPKYINSPDHALFHKGQLLYGLSRARTALTQGSPILVVEGYMDVIALVEAGYSGAVAPLGTALTDDQLQILWKIAPSLENRMASRDYSPVLCFDGDNAGLRAAARAVDRALPHLSAANTLRFVTITGAKDPDELIKKSGKGSFDSLLKQAQPMIEFLWDLTLEGRQLRTPEERASFADALKRRVGQIKDESLQRFYNDAFRARMSETFGWKAKNGNYQKGNKGHALSSVRITSRAVPQNGVRQREKIIIALMINHPVLFDEFGESFALMDFQTPGYSSWRDRIVEYFSEEHDSVPTKEDTRRVLFSSEGLWQREEDIALKEELQSSSFYIGAAKAAHPQATPEAAREAWLAMTKALEQDMLKVEYARALSQYKENASEENAQRLNDLQRRLMETASATE